MKRFLTNIRTKVQFSQYGIVKSYVFNGNKLQAMNAMKRAFGLKELSVLSEYKADGFLPEGNYTTA